MHCFVSFGQDTAIEVGTHRVPVDEVDRNLQEVMEISLDEDCQETKANIRGLHQEMDAVLELLRKKLLAARTASNLGRLKTNDLMKELADMKSWLTAVDRWLEMQEAEPSVISDPSRATQLVGKYEASVRE